MGYIETFKKILLENSDSKLYEEAISEWTYRGESFERKDYCICGHSIEENCPVTNKLNGNTLIIGNCCINKFKIKKLHYNKSKLNYLYLALDKAINQNQVNFINNLISNYNTYSKLRLTEKQRKWLIAIAGVPYRW